MEHPIRLRHIEALLRSTQIQALYVALREGGIYSDTIGRHATEGIVLARGWKVTRILACEKNDTEPLSRIQCSYVIVAGWGLSCCESVRSATLRIKH